MAIGRTEAVALPWHPLDDLLLSAPSPALDAARECWDLRLGADAAGVARGAPRATPVLCAAHRAQSSAQSLLEPPIRHVARMVDQRRGVSGHSERVGLYAALLAENLGLDEEECELIGLASLLHDLGKLGIPTELLLKPGALKPGERALVERHAELGYRRLAIAGLPVLKLAAVIAHTHHERFDGSGYPRGLAGNGIPPAGRIVAVADVLDALTSDRCYRPALTLEHAISMIDDGSGRIFDPAVVGALLDPQGKPLAIAASLVGDASRSRESTALYQRRLGGETMTRREGPVRMPS